MENAKKKPKLYPFSGTKHAHDIDFRRSRVKNELYEAIQIRNGKAVCVISDKDYKALEALEARLDDLMDYMHEGIVWLDGERYALAQECVGWAAGMRH